MSGRKVLDPTVYVILHLLTALILINNLNLLSTLNIIFIIYNTDFALCHLGWPRHILYTFIRMGLISDTNF
jgi:hypothetical protein